MAAVNYKCPNCSAGLVFDSKSQKMSCEFCGSSFTVEELEAVYKGQAEELQEEKEGTWEGFRPQEWQAQEGEKMALWHCPSCGAEIIADENMGAMKCPYCDNPTILPKQFEGIYKPDYVIPFRFDKKQAVKALKELYKGKKFLPDAFADENHLEEIKGMYVPFWFFDTVVHGDYVFDGTHSTFSVEGDFDVTRTSHYRVRRAGNLKFTRVPVDGSKNIDDTMMESVEPFDYNALTEFRYSYLSGYFASKYDQEPDELTERVYERVKDSTEAEIRKSAAGYDTLTVRRSHMEADKTGKVSYALLPVWFLNTTWRNEKYPFVMNGQTGKMCGTMPADYGKFWRYLAKSMALVSVPMTMLLFVLTLTGVL